MKAMRVAQWKRYEKADSKKCTNMLWVAIPIVHDGLDFIELMSLPEGVRMIGGWLLIVQVAARCPTRGVLVTDSGRVLGAREIALKTRAPENHIQECITTLLKFGWLEEFEFSGHLPDAIRTTGQTRQDKTGQERTGADAPPPGHPLLVKALKAANADYTEGSLDEWIVFLTDECECETDEMRSKAVYLLAKAAKKANAPFRYSRNADPFKSAWKCHLIDLNWKPGKAVGEP